MIPCFRTLYVRPWSTLAKRKQWPYKAGTLAVTGTARGRSYAPASHAFCALPHSQDQHLAPASASVCVGVRWLDNFHFIERAGALVKCWLPEKC